MNNEKKKRVFLFFLFFLFAAVFIFSAVMLLIKYQDYRDEVNIGAEMEEEYLNELEPELPEQTTASAEPKKTEKLVWEETTSFTTEISTMDSTGSYSESTKETTSESAPPEIETTTGETTETEPENTTKPETTATTSKPAAPKSIWPSFSVNWDSLIKKNKDTRGWIWIYGTNINYPVLQGENNNTYLYTDISGRYLRSGSIYIDSRVEGDFSSPNTVIYGHNYMRCKFHDLMNYRRQNFYNGHKYVCIFTPENGLQKYVIYSAYITDATSKSYRASFKNADEYARFLEFTIQNSMISSGIKPTVNDRVLTLSTCTNNAPDERMVVHAIPYEE